MAAQITLSSDPTASEVDECATLTCRVQVEELLCPSGTLFLQLSNGSIITETISSSETEIILEIKLFTADDFGQYYCNISIVSPQFPLFGLFAFETLILEGMSLFLLTS